MGLVPPINRILKFPLKVRDGPPNRSISGLVMFFMMKRSTLGSLGVFLNGGKTWDSPVASHTTKPRNMVQISVRFLAHDESTVLVY